MKSINKCGIYIHVPLCRGKCIYCSFYSIGATAAFDWHNFVNALIEEFISRKREIHNKIIETIYIGGGTPSLMPPGELRRLISSIINIINKEYDSNTNNIVSSNDQSPALLGIKEITLEVNPDDVTSELAQEWREAGVNRISMGVQTLNNRELKFIGRRHSAEEAICAFNTLRPIFSNISLDIIFGLPDQDLKSLEETLFQITALHPEHISAYSLMYEERSALIRMLEKGTVREIPEDIAVDMFRMINTILSDAGYERYEISNYSLPGFHSRHNSSYWESIPYIGLGPAAHSYDGANTRRWNKPDLRGYLKIENHGNAPHESEILSIEEIREELLMTRLRVSGGLDLNDYRTRFGEDTLNTLMTKAAKHISSGNLSIDENFLKLTEQGIMISDEILIDLF